MIENLQKLVCFSLDKFLVSQAEDTDRINSLGAKSAIWKKNQREASQNPVIQALQQFRIESEIYELLMNDKR